MAQYWEEFKELENKRPCFADKMQIQIVRVASHGKGSELVFHGGARLNVTLSPLEVLEKIGLDVKGAGFLHTETIGAELQTCARCGYKSMVGFTDCPTCGEVANKD